MSLIKEIVPDKRVIVGAEQALQCLRIPSVSIVVKAHGLCCIRRMVGDRKSESVGCLRNSLGCKKYSI